MRTIVVMAKAPLPGVAKTRLAPAIGMERAARIAEALLQDTLETCSVVGANLVLAYAPSEERAWFVEHAPVGRLLAQTGHDLTGRLQAVTAHSFEQGADRVVVVGTDAPELAPADLDRAFELLTTHPVVLGPTMDGGYWLVGLARHTPELFTAIPWSTDRVFESTRARAAELGLTVGVLDLHFDVDTPSDLDHLARWLATAAPERARHVRAVRAR